MNKNPNRNLGSSVDLLVSALIQSTPQQARAGTVRVVAMRPGDSLAEAQRRVAAFRAKQG
jgi:hypothetical protein